MCNMILFKFLLLIANHEKNYCFTGFFTEQGTMHYFKPKLNFKIWSIFDSKERTGKICLMYDKLNWSSFWPSFWMNLVDALQEYNFDWKICKKVYHVTKHCH